MKSRRKWESRNRMDGVSKNLTMSRKERTNIMVDKIRHCVIRKNTFGVLCWPPWAMKTIKTNRTIIFQEKQRKHHDLGAKCSLMYSNKLKDHKYLGNRVRTHTALTELSYSRLAEKQYKSWRPAVDFEAGSGFKRTKSRRIRKEMGGPRFYLHQIMGFAPVFVLAVL